MATKSLTVNYVVALALMLAVFGSGCSVVQGAQELYKTGDAFMTGLKGGDYAGAYALFDPELQQKVGEPGDLQAMIESNRAQPKAWSFTSFNVTTEKNQTTAKIEGNVTYQDGRAGAVSLEMLRAGEAWKLTSVNFTW